MWRSMYLQDAERAARDPYRVESRREATRGSGRRRIDPTLSEPKDRAVVECQGSGLMPGPGSCLKRTWSWLLCACRRSRLLCACRRLER